MPQSLLQRGFQGSIRYPKAASTLREYRVIEEVLGFTQGVLTLAQKLA